MDAICKKCLLKALQTYSLLKQYKINTLKLHKVVDSINSALNVDINVEHKQVYIICDEIYSELVFVQNVVDEPPSIEIINKCEHCKENFNHIDRLVAHNQHQHDLFTCKKCIYTSGNEDSVKEHENSIELYKCKNCDQVRCTKTSLKDHEDKAHGLYVCKECGKCYNGLDKLLAHELKHVVKNECPKCGKNYCTKEFFEKHMKLCLEDSVDPHPMRSRMEKNHYCRICGKRYSTIGGLRVHERFIHGNAEHQICKKCGKKFTAPCYLKAHLVTHTKEKKFPCDMCSGKFVTKEALLYHRRRHTGDKPYACFECGERFVNASARVDHIKFKHIGPTLSCDFCTRKFVTKTILRMHMVKHHDPKNKLYVGRADVPRNVHN